MQVSGLFAVSILLQHFLLREKVDNLENLN